MRDSDSQTVQKQEETKTQSTTTETTEKAQAKNADTPEIQPQNQESPTILHPVTDDDISKENAGLDITKLGILNDVYIMLTIEIGRAQVKIKDLLNLTKGSIIELDKLAGEPVSIYANGKLISTGNIITANGKYCVRLETINEK